MPKHSHRHPHLKHVALRAVGAGAVVAWRATRVVAKRMPAKRTRVAIVADGEVLLIQNVTNFRNWTLPGGGYHRGESALDCARREIREELGIDIPQQALTATGEFTEEQRGGTYRYDTFIAQFPSEPTINITWEIAHARWFPLDDLPTNISPFIPKLLTAGGIA